MLVIFTLFLIAGLAEKIAGEDYRSEGHLRDYPWLGVGYFIAALTLAGLPPTSGFIGKFALIGALFARGDALAVLVGVAAVVTGGLLLYATVLVWRSFFWGDADAVHSVSLPRGMVLPTAAAVVSARGVGGGQRPRLRSVRAGGGAASHQRSVHQRSVAGCCAGGTRRYTTGGCTTRTCTTRTCTTRSCARGGAGFTGCGGGIVLELLTVLAVALLWAFLAANLTLYNLFIGALLGLLFLSVVRREGERSFPARLVGFARFVAQFLYELFISNIAVALLAVKPRPRLHPHIIAVPLSVKSDAAITLLSAAITLAARHGGDGRVRRPQPPLRARHRRGGRGKVEKQRYAHRAADFGVYDVRKCRVMSGE